MTDPVIKKIIEEAGPNLSKAVKLDQGKKYNDAIEYYHKGIEALLVGSKQTSVEESRKYLRTKAAEYLSRAEELDKQCKFETTTIETRQIAEDSTGHGYDKIFSKCVKDRMKRITVQDPYIRSRSQFLNFLKFCEYMVSNATGLRHIHLITKIEEESKKSLDCLAESLIPHDIILQISNDNNLHDREITFDNGWVVKIGRGLDYFKMVGPNDIGLYDLNLRPCRETTVDIFKKKRK